MAATTSTTRSTLARVLEAVVVALMMSTVTMSAPAMMVSSLVVMRSVVMMKSLVTVSSVVMMMRRIK